jgi:hypothetical protein
LDILSIIPTGCRLHVADRISALLNPRPSAVLFHFSALEGDFLEFPAFAEVGFDELVGVVVVGETHAFAIP